MSAGWMGIVRSLNVMRFGESLLWMRLMSGENRHIPTDRVRTYSIYPESHERPLNGK